GRGDAVRVVGAAADRGPRGAPVGVGGLFPTLLSLAGGAYRRLLLSLERGRARLGGRDLDVVGAGRPETAGGRGGHRALAGRLGGLGRRGRPRRLRRRLSSRRRGL